MKKIILLLVLLLTCCAPVKVTMPPTPDWTKAHSKPTQDLSGYQPNVGAFEFGDQCPHMCWLGINPGVTPAEEVKTLLSGSDQIDPNMEVAETGIVAKWFSEKTKTLVASAYVRFDKGVAQSIAFSKMSPFTLKDIIGIIGDPSGINIDMNIYDNVMEMPYGAYYFTRDILISADATEVGIHPNDAVETLVLNVPYNKDIFRPWVGYGHLAEYFKGKEVHQHPSNP